MKTAQEILALTTKEEILDVSMISDSVNDILIKELVPGSGKCETVEGELLRAINKIGYRFYNDGDLLHTGYGIETAAPAWVYLDSKIDFISEELWHEYKDLISAMATTVDGTDENKKIDYESNILCMIDVINRQVLINRLTGLTPNSEDMLDAKNYELAIQEFGDPNDEYDDEEEDYDYTDPAEEYEDEEFGG